MNYTFHADAEAFLARFADAPDLASHANLTDALKENYRTLAFHTQVLVESNERWATKNREQASAVEAIIENLIDVCGWDSSDMPDAIQELAELFDIDMTEEVGFSGTISFSGYLTKSRFTSASDALADIAIDHSFLRNRHISGIEITSQDGEIDDIDVA